MRRGHATTLAGAVIVMLSSLALVWQRFALADVETMGWQAPFYGQLTLLVALGVAIMCVVALRSARPRRLVVFTLPATVLLVCGVVVASFQRAVPFELMPHEAITMGPGFTVALAGAVLALVGALMVVAARPAWRASERLLRVALIWDDTVIREQVLHEPRALTIGPADDADFVVDAVSDRFTIFDWSPAGYALALDPDLGGTVTTGGHATPLAALRDRSGGDAWHALDEDDWGMVTAGSASIFFQTVSPAGSKAPARTAGAPDEHLGAAMSMSCFAQGAIVVLAVLLWNVDADIHFTPDQRLNADLTAEVNTPLPVQVVELDDALEPVEASKAAGGEEGSFGDPDETRPIETKIPRIDRGKMIERIEDVGLLKLLAEDDPTKSFSSLVSDDAGDFTNRFAVLTAGEGTEVAIGPGAGGLGFQGHGPGGGDDGVGRIKGRSSIDTGPGPGIVRVAASIPRGPRRQVPTMTTRDPVGSEYCKTSDIRSRMARRKHAFRACYEQRLTARADLAGKITLRWTIDMEGQVMGAKVSANTLRDNAVEGCVLRHLRRVRFSPPAGGLCVVQWPLAFSSGQ